ncbi:MAG: HD domain-containing protein [Desulfatitalea sp.]|nr:HD domain-containing protein [Desulfatitalea sp.]NNK01317.1 HD domain-containing protein [Desulfatitalea sp.]
MTDKQRFVNQIKAGENVADTFVLVEKNMARKRDGNAFLNLTLADRTGRIRGVVWDGADRAATGAAAGDFVRIEAMAGEYRGALQLVVRSMAAVPKASISPDDFLPATSRDTAQMLARLRTLMDSIASPPLKALMAAFWQDEDLIGRFQRAPAAKMMHHAYIGGLLEHSLSMALLADKMAAHYGGVDRDLLLVGAVLHDIGKVHELDYTHRIDYTDEGRLLSHIVIGVQIVEEKILTIEAFPQDLAVLIKHMIISHHGAREFGSPELPKTVEAVLLNYVDEIDSRVNAIREHMAAEAPGEAWTSYHRLLERQFYMKRDEG